MTEQWQELKETIIELRDNDGTSTQQEVCGFLANLMDVLEKQMQQTCEDAVSRQAVLGLFAQNADAVRPYSKTWEEVKALLPITPQHTEAEIQKMQELEQAEIQRAYELGKAEESKAGRWRHYEGMLTCSECGAGFYDDIMEYCGDDVPKFCPDCGAKMVEPQESEEV